MLLCRLPELVREASGGREGLDGVVSKGLAVFCHIPLPLLLLLLVLLVVVFRVLVVEIVPFERLL